MSGLRVILIVMPWVCSALCAAAEQGGAVKFIEQSNHVSVSIDGKPFTDYWYAKRDDRPYVRPFFFPVLAPDGTPVTSDQYGPNEHPHHNSLWVGQGDVNGANHWSFEKDPEKTPRQRHIRFEKLQGDTVVEDLEWESVRQEPILRERRMMRFMALGDKSRAIDFTLEFTAMDRAVDFGDTKEAGLVAVRVAKSISDHPIITTAAGVHAEGMKGETAAWGKAADWCDLSGPIGASQYGVAVFDSPENPRHPTRWHVRAYGLLAANPFALHFFDKAPEHTGDFMMEPGKTVTFRYRVLIHEGDAAAARLPENYQLYVH